MTAAESSYARPLQDAPAQVAVVMGSDSDLSLIHI